MSPRVLPLALLALGAALVLSTCTANGGSIYATIEAEQLVGSSTLPKYLVIADIAPTGAGGPYYIAAGAVYQGVMSGTPASMTWNPNSASATTDRPFNPKASDGTTTMLCNNLAISGTDMYGGFFTPSGSQYGLYRSDVTTPSSPGAWTAVTGLTGGATEQVVMTRQVNGAMLVAAGVVSSSSVYTLYTASGTVATQQTTGFARKIVGVVYLPGTTTYYMATDSALYSAAALAGLSAASPLASFTLASGDVINGFYANTANTVMFILTKKNGLYSSSDGTTWTQVAAPTVSSVTVSLLTIAGPVGSSGIYLVGSDGYGYYTLSGTTLTRYADTTVSLYAESVARILIDGTHVFMGTNANGLWGAEFSATTGDLASTWTHEQKN